VHADTHWYTETRPTGAQGTLDRRSTGSC
jgi:hypothetical protein